MSLPITIAFLLILLVVSFLYASVGHGGASGYLALMSIFSFEPAMMKPTALVLNLFVAGLSFYAFKKNDHFRWKLFYPFALGSIPASFIGGTLTIDAAVYKQILGVFILIAVLRLLNIFRLAPRKAAAQINIVLAVLLGLALGLFSGMIGIGGGIILSPLILVLGWGNVKETAAVSALFIFVNSASGLMGHVYKGGSLSPELWYFVPVVIVGGYLGGFWGSGKLKSSRLKVVLAAVLIVASFKLILL